MLKIGSQSSLLLALNAFTDSNSAQAQPLSVYQQRAYFETYVSATQQSPVTGTSVKQVTIVSNQYTRTLLATDPLLQVQNVVTNSSGVSRFSFVVTPDLIRLPTSGTQLVQVVATINITYANLQSKVIHLSSSSALPVGTEHGGQSSPTTRLASAHSVLSESDPRFQLLADIPLTTISMPLVVSNVAQSSVEGMPPTSVVALTLGLVAGVGLVTGVGLVAFFIIRRSRAHVIQISSRHATTSRS